MSHKNRNPKGNNVSKNSNNVKNVATVETTIENSNPLAAKVVEEGTVIEAPKADKKDKAPKQPKTFVLDTSKDTMTRLVDSLIASGGTFADLAKLGNDYVARVGFKAKFSKGYFNSHIAWRRKTYPTYLEDLGIKETDTGFERVA